MSRPSESEDRKYIMHFRDRTRDRINQLEERKKFRIITRAETFELDMCKADLKRAEEYLKK